MSASRLELLSWSEQIAATARTGLAFSDSLYERERYEEILKVAAKLRLACELDGEEFECATTTPTELSEIWLSRIGSGIPGYVTPKVSVGAIVVNDSSEILLIQRGDSGFWLYPTGWADVGYSPAEVVVKEVKEETGIDVECQKILAVLDGMRSGFTSIPMYSIVFLCKVLGGVLKPHPLEALDVGWFALDQLPHPLPALTRRIPNLRLALAGEDVPTFYDLPR